jgi:hypothetical protein
MVAAVSIMTLVLWHRPKPRSGQRTTSGPLAEQAVIVKLDWTRTHLGGAEANLAALENELITIIDRDELGQYDGHEDGPAGTTLFMYGADAEHLFKGVEETLRAAAICTGANITIRMGSAGSPQRSFEL